MTVSEDMLRILDEMQIQTRNCIHGHPLPVGYTCFHCGSWYPETECNAEFVPAKERINREPVYRGEELPGIEEGKE